MSFSLAVYFRIHTDGNYHYVAERVSAVSKLDVHFFQAGTDIIRKS